MTRREITLRPIGRGAVVRGYEAAAEGVVTDVLRASAELYARAGFVAPWICHLAFEGDTPVGTCGFKAPPVEGRAEIAYFTFPGFEGRGHATAMAAALVETARRADASVTVAAQTLPARNASHRVLEKLGFVHVETLQHPEDGEVWEWRLPAPGRTS